MVRLPTEVAELLARRARAARCSLSDTAGELIAAGLATYDAATYDAGKEKST